MFARTFALLAVGILLVPIPAMAQYMYLDSNGDGVNTSADVVHGVGSTQVDVWLYTNQNRDGSTAACVNGPEPLTLGGTFAVILRATGGTVAWGIPTSFVPTMTSPFFVASSATEFNFGFLGASHNPPGHYHLARFTVGVTSGSPSIEIVTDAPTLLPPAGLDGTEFGSQCLGPQYNNTMKLGAEWNDKDGLTFESGGTPNVPPTIPAIDDFNASTGDYAALDITIHDADGDRLEVRPASGPPFFSVTALTGGIGTLAARIHVQPKKGNLGTYDAGILADDGVNESVEDFRISVSSGPNHLPQLARLPQVSVTAGQVATVSLTASDHDGDPLTFSVQQIPAFAQVRPGQSGRGGGTAFLTLRPTLCDVGESELAVVVSDGALSAQADMRVVVHPPQGPIANPARQAGGGGWDVAAGDLNEDGHMDLAFASQFQTGGMYVAIGDGRGEFRSGGFYNLGVSSNSISTGDWNHDGHLDAAIGTFGQGSLTLMYGRGDASFQSPVPFPDVIVTNHLLTADVDGDGVDDLVALGQDGASVLLGQDGVGLAPRSFVAAASRAVAAGAVGDFNQDGNLDLVATFLNASALALFPGRGDGTFGDAQEVPLPATQYSLASGDWNLDGRLDLVVGSFEDGTVTRLLGDGGGHFAVSSLGSIGTAYVGDIEAVDWDRDGLADLLFATDSGTGASAILRGRPSGGFDPGTLPFPSPGSSAICAADFNEDGAPDVAGAQGAVLLNTTSSHAGVVARAFLLPDKTISAVPSSGSLTARLEPVDGTFRAIDIDGVSVKLVSRDTGSASSIPANLSKSSVVGDTDQNGVDELPVAFLMTDVARLFDGLRGRQRVDVQVEGALQNGARLCAPMSLTIVGHGGAVAGRVEPNPLNPNGALRFAMERSGKVTVRLFDARGHLVRTLWEAHPTEPGPQEVRIDGLDGLGRAMASGVYFFRIDAAEKTTTGRFAILR